MRSERLHSHLPFRQLWLCVQSFEWNETAVRCAAVVRVRPVRVSVLVFVAGGWAGGFVAPPRAPAPA